MVGPNKRVPLKPSARDSARLGLGEVDIIAPGLIHARFVGRVRLEHLEPVMTTGEQVIAGGHRLLVVIDADDVHAYDSECRKVFQTWIRHHRSELEGVWVLFRSPLIKMGISLVNAVTNGIIRGFSDPTEFEMELAEATARAQAGSTSRPAVH